MFAKKIRVLSLSLVLSALPVSVLAASFTELVVFGDSLSDAGNAALFTMPNFQEVPFGGLVPSLPYENGRLTNGLTWVENLAASLGLEASPSFDNGTIFAFGAARTGPRVDQFGIFQSQTEGVASSEALYVVWGGSNNLISEAAIQKQEGDDAGASATISQAVNDITTNC